MRLRCWMVKHQCHDRSCEGLFHCPICSGIFNLEFSDIVGVILRNGKDEVVCEGCARQLGVLKWQRIDLMPVKSGIVMEIYN